MNNQHNQLNLTVKNHQAKPRFALFNLAFRPFFLMGAGFSVVSMAIWTVYLIGGIDLSVYGGAHWWHIHEMLFGFVGAIIIGFLLTAVKTWTSLPAVTGVRLVVLVLFWLSARLAMLANNWLPAGLIVAIDLLFFPLAAIFLAWPIIQRRMWRNLIFVPVLLLMTYANAHMHCAVYLPGGDHLRSAGFTQVLLVVLLMVIMGGRVIPMFTANGTQTPRVRPIKVIELASVGGLVLLVLIQLFSIQLPVVVIGSLFFIVAIINAARAYRWQIGITWHTPLVWSLHISYWCIPIGLLLLGLSLFSTVVSHSQAIHSLTLGAIGVMILSMISRVSLGHTGREIVVKNVMALAFACVFIAFIIRVFGNYFFNNLSYVYLFSAIFWILGYGLFLINYTQILISPRVDGKSG